MNRIRISNEVRSHLALHFQQELPGSKFFADSPDVFLNLAQQLFPKVFSSAKPDYDGRIRISLIFPNKIGISNVVHIDELSDDEKRRIEIIDRDGKKVRRVKIDRIIPTNECQIILSTNWDLITMFPGEMAPPLPASLDIPNEYWGQHVFIEPFQ